MRSDGKYPIKYDTHLIGFNDKMDDLLLKLILGPFRCLGSSLCEFHNRCLAICCDSQFWNVREDDNILSCIVRHASLMLKMLTLIIWYTRCPHLNFTLHASLSVFIVV